MRQNGLMERIFFKEIKSFGVVIRVFIMRQLRDKMAGGVKILMKIEDVSCK